MSAPDRPTRDQVADALALIDDLFATFLIPHDDADPMYAGWTRGASVRADVAQEWRDRRAALVARTPQTADPADTAQVGDQLGQAWAHAQEAVADGGCRALMPGPEGARWMCTRSAHPGRQHVATIGGKVVGVSPSAPLPAVPDGEDEGRHEVKCPSCDATIRARMADVLDGGDVPARLDAAAAVLGSMEAYGARALTRQLASALRGCTPEHRAAVAAALALPTAGEEK